MRHDAGQELRERALGLGADLVGVADLTPLKADPHAFGPELLEPFTRGVSLAVRLEDAAVETIERAPTLAYARNYREANARLDRISDRLAAWIRSRGHAAAAVPASAIIDEQRLLGALPHRAVARLAGIGWQGKSLLIVTPQFGPRVRLTTVLTDLPCVPDVPLKQRCGSCSACAVACPAGAIKNARTSGGYLAREEALYLERCARQTALFGQREGIGSRVCGICVAVCPHGRPRARSAKTAA